ncbi:MULTISPECIES: ArsC family reductase [Caldimonas]|uniref:ArsC family reductase n=1 Tax=Caldimonas TaxID=196013 RepID=UPI00037B69AB|nr:MULTISPECIES: ArsC family reductase [Caldimonas]MCX7660541.1 ArsC family reductase [Caldimonas manganoxidans]GIX25860.1 MAG: arsenate reductase [Caldimonas sp.]
MIKVYGISNCDTVKKARRWLDQRGLAYQFHDFKKLGVPEDRLAHWLRVVGPERLLNRQGTTWRRLDASAQAAASTEAGARALMQAQPSVIKRPVIEVAEHVLVGFDEATYARLMC